ncbi:MAG: thiamine pyrophosphate-binding protein [Myxococcota bacterium]
MASSNERVADVLARALARETRFAFGVPGGEVLTMVDALHAAGVRFVLCRHETSGGFMAEGIQRTSGDLGLLVATLGPGVANAVNVASHAQQSRRPLIVLTGCASVSDRGTYTHQIYDHQALLRPLVKGAFEVGAQNVADVIARSIDLAKGGVPGAVHVELPVDVADLSATSQDVAMSHREPASVQSLTGLAHPSPAAEALAKAQRPIALAGLELLLGEGAEVFRQRMEALGWPVLTSYEGKGIVDEHRLPSVAAVGLSERVDSVALELLHEADAVLLAGFDPIEVRHRWRHAFQDHQAVIEVTREAGQHAMYGADHRIVGEPGAILRSLLGDLTPPSEWGDAPARARQEVQRRLTPETGWGPATLLRALEDGTPDDAIVTVDTGAHRILLCEQWRFSSPRRLYQSNGSCTMACAVPLAIGAKLAAPDTSVLAVVGDGGLEMALGELGTARDEGLPVVIAVVDDRSLALIEKKQRARGFVNVGVDFGPEAAEGTDYAAIARAFGGRGVRVQSAAEVKAALAEAFAADTFTLLHCPVPRRSY